MFCVAGVVIIVALLISHLLAHLDIVVNHTQCICSNVPSMPELDNEAHTQPSTQTTHIRTDDDRNREKKGIKCVCMRCDITQRGFINSRFCSDALSLASLSDGCCNTASSNQNRLAQIRKWRIQLGLVYAVKCRHHHIARHQASVSVSQTTELNLNRTENMPVNNRRKGLHRARDSNIMEMNSFFCCQRRTSMVLTWILFACQSKHIGRPFCPKFRNRMANKQKIR